MKSPWAWLRPQQAGDSGGPAVEIDVPYWLVIGVVAGVVAFIGRGLWDRRRKR